MITDVDIARRVRVTIARELACPMRRLADNAELRRDLGAAAAAIGGLHAAIEGEFAIRMTAAELAFCQTVGTLADLVRTKLENKELRR